MLGYWSIYMAFQYLWVHANICFWFAGFILCISQFTEKIRGAQLIFLPIATS